MSPEEQPKSTESGWVEGQQWDAVANGKHVHRIREDGQEYCMGGDSKCPFFDLQLREAMETWS